MAGNSFIVTVSAPNAPWIQTHTSVTVGHHGLSTGALTAAPAPRCAREREYSTQLATVITRIRKPTLVAR